jgi:hypothetical protein
VQPGLDKLVVGADYIKLIWVPDTFFVNEKVASFHQATQVLLFLHSAFFVTENVASFHRATQVQYSNS